MHVLCNNYVCMCHIYMQWFLSANMYLCSNLPLAYHHLDINWAFFCGNVFVNLTSSCTPFFWVLYSAVSHKSHKCKLLGKCHTTCVVTLLFTVPYFMRFLPIKLQVTYPRCMNEWEINDFTKENTFSYSYCSWQPFINALYRFHYIV